jgi:dehydrogenase/reductase SDR family protein 12
VGSFSRLGYQARRRIWSWAPPGLPASGNALITGATGGIGAAIARGLAESGLEVTIVGRDPTRTAREAAVMTAATGRKVKWLNADLTDLDQTRQLALRARSTSWDVVVHNAGAIPARFREVDTGTAGGRIEASVALHVLSPFVLTETLLPFLPPGARVLTLSSGGMYTQRLDVAQLEVSPQGYRPALVYARGKRAQVVLTRKWAERHPGVFFASLHPGWVATPGLAKSLPHFYRQWRPLLRRPEEGADTAIWLAAVPSHQLGPSGLFWGDRRPRRQYRLPRTRETVGESERLWEWCLARTGHPVASPAS